MFQATFRNSDIIARLGGDEFVVIPIGTKGDNIDIVIRRLRRNLDFCNTKEEMKYRLSMRKTLQTTNPIESCFSVARTITGRVKRWKGDDMVQRWAVASLLRAEKKFRRVKGYKEIPKLVAALQLTSIDRKEVAA